MKPAERVETALRGLKPDLVPIFPLYNYGYFMSNTKRDKREFLTASGKQRIEYNEQAFLLHEADGFVVTRGCNDNWVDGHDVKKLEDYWLATQKSTGKKYRLLPDSSRVEDDDALIKLKVNLSNTTDLSDEGTLRIFSNRDIDKAVPPVPTEADIEESGIFWPLKHMEKKYPAHHFSFQRISPFPQAVNACGGYVEGLVTMANNPILFKEIIERYALNELAFLGPGKSAGGRSVLLTSYYTGADTISPECYAEFVFPYEKMICEKAKKQGLYVLYWFLGDLMPVLEIVRKLPVDALYLEQGRKNYSIDSVEIRKKAGGRLCLFSCGYEMDFCDFNRENLTREFTRQLEGAGREGAFIAGTPVMPENAKPEAVDYYFKEIRRIGRY